MNITQIKTPKETIELKTLFELHEILGDGFDAIIITDIPPGIEIWFGIRPYTYSGGETFCAKNMWRCNDGRNDGQDTGGQVMCAESARKPFWQLYVPVETQISKEKFGFNTLKPKDIAHAKEVMETNRFCYKHGVHPCNCRPSNCCSKYTHGCGPMNHRLFDPDMNGA